MSGIRYQRRSDGRVAAWVFAGGDRVLLRRAAEVVEQQLGALACERFDGGDQVFLDFTWLGGAFTLLYARDEGVGVLSGDGSAAAEALARRIAEHLERSVAP